MKILNYQEYNKQLSSGFESLPVLVGSRGAGEKGTVDFKVVKSGLKIGTKASMVEVKTKKQVLALLEEGNIQVQKRRHNCKTEMLCYLTRP